MNTLTKILLAAVAAVLLVFVAIAVAVAFVFEPNDYRPFVVDSVQKATGRDFALDGDLELALFPCCGVKVGSARLGNPAGFPEGAFASIGSAAVSVKIWPLLTRREVQIGTVTLEGVDVELLELPDGRTNWTFASEEPAAAAEAETGPTIASLSIEGLNVRDGNVSYRAADGSHYSARDINLESGAIDGDAPVPVALKLTARDERAGTAADLELAGSLALAGEVVDLTEPRLTVRATGADLPTGNVDLDLTATGLRYHTTDGTAALQTLDAAVTLPGTRFEVTGDAAFDGEAATGSGGFRIAEGNLRRLLEAMPDAGYVPAGSRALERVSGSGRWALTGTGAAVSELDLALDDSRITGSAGVTSFDTGAATARLDIDRIGLDDYQPEAPTAAAGNGGTEPMEIPFDDLAALLLDAELEVGELTTGGITLGELNTKLKSDGRNLSVSVGSELFGGRLTLTGSGSVAGAAAGLTGRLELNGISPRAALTALGEPPETANPEVLTRLSGSTQWRLGRRSLALEQMSWQLDDTRLTGTLGIDGFDTPATRFDLALDRMNLDDYLAPESGEAVPADDADVEIPVEVIRGLDLQGRLQAAAMRIMDLDLTGLDATVTARDGVLRLEPLLANLYGGSYRGTIAIDATGAKSRLSLDQQLSAVQVGQVLNALVGSDRISGALTFKLAGAGVGNTQKELLQALTGNLDFNLSDGIYHGMDIAYEIENAQSLLKRTAAPERPNRKETPIRALTFAGRMADGVLGSDNLNAEIPFLKLGGRGGVNLVDRTLDYQLNAQVLKTADSASGSGLKGLGGSTIPLTITGPMADPSVRVNLQGLVVETVKDKARDALLKRLGVDQQEGSAAGSPASGTAATSSAAATSAAPAADSLTTEPATTNSSAESSASDKATDAEPSPQPTTRDLIEQGLRGLLKRPEAEKTTEKP
ncbi:MAG: AsmA family protein [Pseudomonadales bacterium]